MHTNQPKDKPMRFSSFYRTTTIVTPNNYTYSSFTRYGIVGQNG
jgi:hypothetical protein